MNVADVAEVHEIEAMLPGSTSRTPSCQAMCKLLHSLLNALSETKATNPKP